MIAYLKGKITQKETTFVLIEVQGVGYFVRVSVPTSELLVENSDYQLHTHLQIKEDSHSLYGFLDVQEKSLFLNLIEVSGIGANTAMIILSSMSIAEVKAAIVQENVKAIQNIKGIGLKTAQRLILELKDKLKKDYLETTAISTTANTTAGGHTARIMKTKADSLAALMALGIPKTTAEKNIDAVIKKHGGDITTEQMIKYALQS
ncbi:MAG: Holliday junction branch migration protein RuvA [Bacteroidetes bacterium]|nr:MAG: Holliday junction branch migration protein RuvA [Bacteroidota bacterium]TAG93189.1 MAG: Holliday junction branch migration protein RuvA [Bacteroidota bacterium]